MDSEDDEEDAEDPYQKDIIFNSGFGATGAIVVNRTDNPDSEFDGELGYALIKALRGKTTGRKLKRSLFKLGMIELLCGIALSIMTVLQWINFVDVEYYYSYRYGSSLLNLNSVVSFPSLLAGILSLVAVRNWASLTTNRTLLSNLCRCYMLGCAILLVFALWTTVATFETFQKVKDWNRDVIIAEIYPYYVCTELFLIPLVVALAFYTLDISWHIEQLDQGGVILEPNPPDHILDMSDVTLFQSCVFVCAMPCIVCLQCSDLVSAFAKAYRKHYRDKPLFAAKKRERKGAAPPTEDPAKKKGHKFLRRLAKTVMRWFSGAKRNAEVVPVPQLLPDELDQSSSGGGAPLQLADLQKDREKEEREQREQAIRQAQERRRLKELQDAELEAERRRKEEEAMLAAAKAINDRKMLEDAERLKQEAMLESVLTVQKFKSLWSTLDTAGSFQCNLQTLPAVTNLTEHLKKQGFHVVFAAKPSPTDIELGICNVRKHESESWFMARFLATNNSFSAVMKAQNSEQVTDYVKKFALAKILKIEK